MTQLWGGKIFSVRYKHTGHWFQLPKSICVQIQYWGKWSKWSCVCLKHLFKMSKDKCVFEVIEGSRHRGNNYGNKPCKSNKENKAKLETHTEKKSRQKDVCACNYKMQAKIHFHCLPYILHKPLLCKITQLRQLLVYFCVLSCRQKGRAKNVKPWWPTAVKMSSLKTAIKFIWVHAWVQHGFWVED